MKSARDLIRKNLKRLRQERGIAASKIARILGVETNHIYRIERGESILIPENMDLICEAFNIDQSYFLIDHDKPQNALIDGVPANYTTNCSGLKIYRQKPGKRDQIYQISNQRNGSRRKTNK